MRNRNQDMSGGRAWNETIPRGGGGSINGRITGLSLCSPMTLSATFDSVDVNEMSQIFIEVTNST